ncbi:MAG TPA: aspartyl protease family protein [Candidatus Eisenbacteria bacterium]|nr:aspartyl protease family protein [Candidatus Eisenbacteria bacterium]
MTLTAATRAAVTSSGVIEVPFVYEASSICIEARVDGGRKLRMLLDTGWGPTTLDTHVAQQLGWLAPGQDPARLPEHRLAEMRLGDLVLRNWPVDILALDGINPPGTEPYDGVLGCGTLRDRVVQIDYTRRVLRFLPRPPAPALNTDRRTTVPIHFSALGCLPITDSLWVNGRRLSGVFDTGGSVQFLITPRAVEYLGLTDSVRNMRAVTSGYFTVDSARAGVARLGRLRQVRVGSIVADTTRAVFGGRGEGLMDQPLTVWGVIVGNRFLEKFLVTFDFVGNLVTLERPAPAGVEVRSTP